MMEYFVECITFSCHTPIGESLRAFFDGVTPEEAAQAAYDRWQTHPYGLGAVRVWTDANAFHKKMIPLIEWQFDRHGTRWVRDGKELVNTETGERESTR